MSFGHAAYGEVPYAASVDLATPNFVLSPSATHVTGTLHVIATGNGTSWTVSNPFSIISGPASGLTNYSNNSSTSAEFDITVTSISATPIVISDGTTRYHISAAAVVPGAPTIGTLTNNDNGTVTVTFTAPADNGGAAISSYTATLNTGQQASGASSPLIVTATIGVSTTATVRATNSAGTGEPSAASNAVTPTRQAQTYFVDNAGIDSNSGLSGSPWQTVAAVNAFALLPGDTVKFTAGQTFAGPLVITRSGSSGALITFTTTSRTPGDTAQSGPATINAVDGDGIQITNAEYTWVDNFIASGSGVNTSTGATTSTGKGVNMYSNVTSRATRWRGNKVTAVTVIGCKDGMFCWCPDPAVQGVVGFEDLHVWGLDVHACQRVGFIMSCDGPFPSGGTEIFANVYIGYSQVYDCPGKVSDVCGEGITVRNCLSGIVEYSVVHDINVVGTQGFGGTQGFAAIRDNGVIVQHCEAYNIFAPINVDGVGIDIESGSIGCIGQYNYIHDCEGGGLMTGSAGGNTTGNIYRYNMVARNSSTNGSDLINVGGVAGGVGATITCEWYGNTVYASNGHAADLLSGDKVYNSILIAKAGFKSVNGSPGALKGNLYYAIGGGTITVITHTSIGALRAAGFESHLGVNYGIFGNPLLTSPTLGVGVGTLPGAPVSTILYFDIPTNSPAVDAGILLSILGVSPGLYEFHGDPNINFPSGKMSIGADGTGPMPSPPVPQSFIDWLVLDRRERVVLVEAQAYSGSLVTRYASNYPFVSAPTDSPANQVYDDIVTAIPHFTARMSEAFGERTGPSWGEVEFSNENGDRDSWLDDGWDGRNITLYYGDAEWEKDEFQRILNGTVADISLKSRGTLALKLRDKQWRLNVPIQTSLIAGTTANLDQPIPMCFGECYNIEPVLIDSALKKYQFHDGAVEDVVTVYDNGVSVGFTKDVSAGTFTLTASPAGRITADVKGAKPGGIYLKTCAKIIEWLVLNRSTITAGELDAAAFAALHTLCPQTLGIYLRDRANLLEVIDQLVATIGGWHNFTRDGYMIVGRLDAPSGLTQNLDMDPDDLVERQLSCPTRRLPVKTIRLGYKKNWTVQTDGVAGSVTEARRAELAAPYRVVKETNVSVLTEHPLAPEPDVIETLLVNITDAQTEAARRSTLYSVVRGIYEAEAFAAPFSVRIGNVVRLFHPRFGFSTGAKAVVVGITENPMAATSKLELWK